MTRLGRGMLVGCATLAIAACTEVETTGGEKSYLGVETRKLDDELVSILVRMTGAEDKSEVAEYGKCAAARYALIRGYGFARHVRTNVQERGGIWAADAVYTISAALPEGLQTIDAEVAVEDCAAKGIPTV